MRIGILGLQGAVREHRLSLQACGLLPENIITVKKPGELDDLQGLVIPGGESTTLGLLMTKYGFLEPIREKARQGMGILGTCAGMVLLAGKINGHRQPTLGLLEMEIVRNGFGSQIESFETELFLPDIATHPGGTKPFPAVFIRAPYGINPGPRVQVLAALGEKIVLARQGKLLACAFHPELTADYRLHRYFLSLIAESHDE